MRHDRPRAFKSHSAPTGLPYVEAGGGKDVRYIVVVRNPEESVVSAKSFFDKHTDEWLEFWDVPKGALNRSYSSTFYYKMNAALFSFVQAWSPLRNKPNVQFLHFTDMKRDDDGSIRRTADSIGAQHTDEQWGAVTEYTSLAWMKQHGITFNATTATEVPVLESRTMVRRGQAGAAAGGGMTSEISEHLRKIGARTCPDDDARGWLYGGAHSPDPGTDTRRFLKSAMWCLLARRSAGQARRGSMQADCAPPEPVPRRPPSAGASPGNLADQPTSPHPDIVVESNRGVGKEVPADIPTGDGTPELRVVAE